MVTRLHQSWEDYSGGKILGRDCIGQNEERDGSPIPRVTRTIQSLSQTRCPEEHSRDWKKHPLWESKAHWENYGSEIQSGVL
jgi:hypothetical protein